MRTPTFNTKRFYSLREKTCWSHLSMEERMTQNLENKQACVGPSSFGRFSARAPDESDIHQGTHDQEDDEAD